MRLEKGDMIKTELGDNTMVLDVKDNQMVLFSNNQFAIATGMKLNEESGKFEWDNARYANDLKSISNMQNNSFGSMKETLSFLAEYNHRDFVKGIISLETGVENESMLDNAYENYMNDSVMGLVDERLNGLLDEELSDENTLNQEIIEEAKQEEYPSKEQETSQSTETDASRDDEENVDYTPKDNKEESDKEDTKEEKAENINEKTSTNTKKDKQYIKGNLASDVEIKDLKSNDGEEFRVANFSIAQNDGMGNVRFLSCFAYNEQSSLVENFQKGDFVSLSGKEKQSTGKNGKEYTSFRVYTAKLLKAKERDAENAKSGNEKQANSKNQKEKPRQSTLGKLKEYKEKANDTRKEGIGINQSKNVER